ncbi:hypothetical protein BELL_1031g00020 [Botrytis elliptica]|uniref:Uncharacterized protein n=1 Tax=Botrytis elliptica TaxID=278938 RepID=A0A4Z1ITS3_9HELO|nr:hypothetical protein EAE99_004034 [Botrytis elliptica]TGO64765.1 hypothetical protein BELL_1031g00020 [Botrytis elliptica]
MFQDTNRLICFAFPPSNPHQSTPSNAVQRHPTPMDPPTTNQATSHNASTRESIHARIEGE